jgi:hypothetical protein
MWVVSWDHVEEIGRPSPFQQKIIVTIFFKRTGECKIAILPEGYKMNNIYFIGCVVQPLVEMCSPDGRRIHERKVMLHLDNGRIHNAGRVQEHWAGFDSRDWNIHPIA